MQERAPLGEVFERIADALSGLGTGTTSTAVLAVAAAGVIAAAVVQLAKAIGNSSSTASVDRVDKQRSSKGPDDTVKRGAVRFGASKSNASARLFA